MVADDLSYIDRNYESIVSRVRQASEKYRNGEEISIIGVTKTVSPQAVNRSIDLGIKVLGENRVQEYLSKKDEYRKGVDVHFIGHLQSNKVKYIINDVSLIHSVDSEGLARQINSQAGKNSKIQDILLEINIGEEDSKSGIAAKDAAELCRAVLEMENLRLRGLMTIPPVGQSEKFLPRMQELFAELKIKLGSADFDTLSMGMSGDFEEAIRYGATCVRIGTALYGARDYTK